LPTSEEAQTPAAATVEAEPVITRSTAGSCFGRFIGLLLFGFAKSNVDPIRQLWPHEVRRSHD
jgi:hypothetical protein